MLRSPLALLPLVLAALLSACEANLELSSSDADLDASSTAEVTSNLDFTLQDLQGNSHDLSDHLADGKTVVLEWFNPDCPYVKRYHQEGVGSPMSRFVEEVAADDVVWLAINSGAPGKQGAGQERNLTAVSEYAIDYPVLLDESGEVGRLFGAQTTPHMFVITPNDGLIYQGAIDDSEGRGGVGNSYVSAALEAHRAGEAVTAPETKPFGCTVKYDG